MFELSQKIFQESLQAITPQSLLEKSLKLDGEILSIQDNTIDLSAYRNIYLCGSGKASVAMAEAVVTLLGSRIKTGVIVTPYAVDKPFKQLQTLQSTHPLPSIKSIEAADALIAEFNAANEEDLILYLLSGGSSALIEKPIAGITLEQMQACTQAMLHGGVEITQMNSVRKHLSAIKGGRLAQMSRATIHTLLFSDVLGNSLHSIGSAPLYCDESSFDDALQAIDKLNVPAPIREYLQAGKAGKHPETPKHVAPHVTHHLIASNETVLQTVQKVLAKHGMKAHIATQPIEGDAEAVASNCIDVAKRSFNEADAVIFGGEAIVHVTGDGYGGRNQHTVLHALDALAKEESMTFMSFATDGIDGKSSAAGAMANSQSLTQAVALGLDAEAYSARSDSFHFFEALQTLLVSGPTHNNLLDVIIIFKKEFCV